MLLFLASYLPILGLVSPCFIVFRHEIRGSIFDRQIIQFLKQVYTSKVATNLPFNLIKVWNSARNMDL